MASIYEERESRDFSMSPMSECSHRTVPGWIWKVGLIRFDHRGWVFVVDIDSDATICPSGNSSYQETYVMTELKSCILCVSQLGNLCNTCGKDVRRWQDASIRLVYWRTPHVSESSQCTVPGWSPTIALPILNIAGRNAGSCAGYLCRSACNEQGGF